MLSLDLGSFENLEKMSDEERFVNQCGIPYTLSSLKLSSQVGMKG